jgi:predicted ATPase
MVQYGAFLRRAIEVALDDYAHAPRGGSQWIFFDRGLIDSAAALHALSGASLYGTR